jgi:hypothetical protein
VCTARLSEIAVSTDVGKDVLGHRDATGGEDQQKDRLGRKCGAAILAGPTAPQQKMDDSTGASRRDHEHLIEDRGPAQRLPGEPDNAGQRQAL